MAKKGDEDKLRKAGELTVRNRTLSLIERKDDIRS
jgi:hypothetical protein